MLVGVGTQATGDDVADEGVVHQDREGHLFHDFKVWLNKDGEGRGNNPAEKLAFGIVDTKNVQIIDRLKEMNKCSVVLLLITSGISGHEIF